MQKLACASTAQAQTALQRLEPPLLLFVGKRRNEFATDKLITILVPGITSIAHKNLQRQILQMALDAIDNVTASEKDITCIP